MEFLINVQNVNSENVVKKVGGVKLFNTDL